MTSFESPTVRNDGSQLDHETEVGSVTDLFAAQVRASPEAVAVVFEDSHLTYRQLNERAEHVALRLRALGVGSEVLVGIYVERSLDMLVGILGIHKAGGAYVPLDPSFPRDRIAYILADAKPTVLLTQTALLPTLPSSEAVVVCLDGPEAAAAPPESLSPSPKSRLKNLAYVLYTSGSTGKPKGVQIEHYAFLNFLRSFQHAPGLTREDVLLAVATYTFDMSCLDMFLPLTVGARVVIAPWEAAADGARLVDALTKHSVTVMQATPTTWRMMIGAGWSASPRLKVLSGGEALPLDLAKDLLKRCGELWNLYGPTETTVYSSIYRITSEVPPVSVGLPIANTEILLLDDSLQPVAAGEVGEIHIGGHGLARGYHNRPELTAEKFITIDKEDETRRFYKTGDLGRLLTDGTLECLGRVDHQIKLRGFRIELGEIESTLAQHPLVKQAVVTAYETPDHDKRLAAYVLQHHDVVVADEARQVAQWQTFHDETYRQPSPTDDPERNSIGWVNSYTGAPISKEELDETFDQTIASVRALNPDKLVAIGCGTGILLFPIAPQCSEYWGLDISEVALKDLAEKTAHLPQVKLLHREGDDFSGVPEGVIDTVLLNSVAQFFPSVDYLFRVIEGGLRLLRDGGSFFIGDIRNLKLLRAFHASIELESADSAITQTEWRRRTADRLAFEEQLVLDPEFFVAMKERFPRISDVEIRLKKGAHQNEISRFHYDVVLRVGAPPVSPWPGETVQWAQSGLSVKAVRNHLNGERPGYWRINGVPNARLDSARQLIVWLIQSGPANVGAMRRDLGRIANPGVDPQRFWELGESLPYEVSISWSTTEGATSYDVFFRRNDVPPASTSAGSQSRSVRWTDLANHPQQAVFSRKVAPRLRSFLQDKLTDYMVPSAYVVVDSFPLTPNGKLDRNALPSPEIGRIDSPELYVEPRTPTEITLAKLWRQVLGVESIGVRHNFFDLGGHSLLAARVTAEIKAVLGVSLPIAAIFEAPTIEQLAAVLSAGSVEETILVAINANGSKKPFFCIAGYFDLARHLSPEQPFYGPDLPTVDRVFYNPIVVEEAAEMFLEQIRKIQPHGPYSLGGHCLGAAIAYEMSQRLVADGEKVSLLAMFDPEAPFRQEGMEGLFHTHFFRYVHHIREVVRSHPKDIPAYLLKRLRNGANRIGLRLKSFWDPKSWGTYQALAVQNKYVPRPYTGRVALFVARSSTFRLRPERDPRLQWGELAAGGFDFHEIPGEHDSFLQEPNVQSLAKLLRPYLDEAGETASR